MLYASTTMAADSVEFGHQLWAGRTPIFWKMPFTCFFTVFSEMNKRRPICWLLNPSAMSAAISCSRAVRLVRPTTGLPSSRRQGPGVGDGQAGREVPVQHGEHSSSSSVKSPDARLRNRVMEP